jgi:hypothetical protein
MYSKNCHNLTSVPNFQMVLIQQQNCMFTTFMNLRHEITRKIIIIQVT